MWHLTSFPQTAMCQNLIRLLIFQCVYPVNIQHTFHDSLYSSHLPRVVRLYEPATLAVQMCHMSPLQWWHMSLPKSYTCTCPVSNLSMSACQCTLPHQLYDRMVCTFSFHMELYRLYNYHFFACLPKGTDCDILRIRHLFEPVQVALGLYIWGLHTRPFWSHYEKFVFQAFLDPFWPLDPFWIMRPH